MSNTITVDTSKIQSAISDIEFFFKSSSFEEIRESISNRFLSFFDGIIPDNSIISSSSTSSAGDIVIVLDVFGDFKIFTSAIRTGNYNLICRHD